jgi:hypothetical protein
MVKIAKGKTTATALDTVIAKNDTAFVKNKIRMYFTSNHDENSWNSADFGTMPGDIHAPFAVITQTIKNTVPLIYGGQEEPFLDSLKFFVKDTIVFGKFKRERFYKTLLHLRKNNAALAPNANYVKLTSSNDDAIFAYARQASKNKIVVITNLSNKSQTFTLSNTIVDGEAENIFTNKKEQVKSNKTITLKAWGYLVYKY